MDFEEVLPEGYEHAFGQVYARYSAACWAELTVREIVALTQEQLEVLSSAAVESLPIWLRSSTDLRAGDGLRPSCRGHAADADQAGTVLSSAHTHPGEA